MKKAIKDYSSDAIAIAVLAIIATFVGGYILSNQRFYLPAWVPFVGTDFYTLNAEMQTAQAITPGQGQTVAMAGVPVGEISAVTLKNGRAVVKMSIQAQYADDIHKNATILTRPKTGLNDMLLQLNPGTKSSGSAPDGYTIPVSQTLPNVNPDEVLSALDTGTRNYLKLLVGGAGQGLHGNRKALAATLRRFDPTARDIDKITKLLAVRHSYVKRNIHNLRLIGEALADKDQDLTAFIDSSNAVFKDFAAQDQNVRSAIGELPAALNATNQAVISANQLGTKLGPTLTALEPFALNLKPAQVASQDFFEQTTAVLKNQLRPFSVAAQPTVRVLKPTAANLAAAAPDVTQSLNVLNYLFNVLAYNPNGNAQPGFLFYLSWANHIAASLSSQQDALGPLRRALLLVDCSNANVVESLAKNQNNPLGALSMMANIPTAAAGGCTGAARSASSTRAAKTSNASGGTGAATTTATTPAATTPAATTESTSPVVTATPPATTTPQAAQSPALTDVPVEGGTR